MTPANCLASVLVQTVIHTHKFAIGVENWLSTISTGHLTVYHLGYSIEVVVP